MQGKVQLYTGKGKGKTTAALGLGLRASGAGKRVIIVQFLKPGGSSEELGIEKLENFEIESYGPGYIYRDDMDESERGEVVDSVRDALERVEEILEEGNCDVLILDELNVALYFDLVEEEEVLDVLEKRPEDMEIVITGRNAPDKLIEEADLVTEMKKIKHYYDEGVEAREGIEY